MATCPYCEGKVTLQDGEHREETPLKREIHGALKKEAMYVCPHCDKVLGFGSFIGGLLTGRP